MTVNSALPAATLLCGARGQGLTTLTAGQVAVDAGMPRSRLLSTAPWERRPVMTPHAYHKTVSALRDRVNPEKTKATASQRANAPPLQYGLPWSHGPPAGKPNPLGAETQRVITVPTVAGKGDLMAKPDTGRNEARAATWAAAARPRGEMSTAHTQSQQKALASRLGRRRQLARVLRRKRRLRAGLVQLFAAAVAVGLGVLLPQAHIWYDIPVSGRSRCWSR